MNNLRQAAQAALEALEQTHKGHWPDDAPEVIAALRAALAEPQPEPVAQSRTIREIICYIRENDLGGIGDEWIAALQAPQAQQPLTGKSCQQCYDEGVKHGQEQPQPDGARAALIELEDEIAKLKALRKPITDDQIRELVEECGLDWHRGFHPLYPGDTTNRYAVLVREVEGIYNSEAP